MRKYRGNRSGAEYTLETDRMSKVSVVLPAYNEEASIGALLERIQGALCELPLEYEVIVVDDGSSDDTVRIVEGRSQTMPIRIIRHATNAGYGAALRSGLYAAAEEGDVTIPRSYQTCWTLSLAARTWRSPPACKPAEPW